MKSSKYVFLVFFMLSSCAQAQLLSLWAVSSHEKQIQTKYIQQKKVEIMELRLKAQGSVQKTGYHKALYIQNAGYAVEYIGFEPNEFINVSSKKNIYVANPTRQELSLGIDYQDWLRVNYKEKKLIHVQVSESGTVLSTDVLNLPTRNYFQTWKERPITMTAATVGDVGIGYLVYDQVIKKDGRKKQVAGKLDANGNCPDGLSPGSCADLQSDLAALDAGVSQGANATDDANAFNFNTSGDGNNFNVTVTGRTAP